VTVAVEVGTGRRVRLLVTDEGPGIPPEAASRIFDAFYTTRSHGAGIGLAVVRRIIDDHAPFGASIDVHSTANGATFEVGLARAEHVGRRESPASPDPGVMATANGRSRPAES
jgi:signal transduction histidine kinase